MLSPAQCRAGLRPIDLLRFNALHFCDKIAIRIDGRCLTYGQLGKLVDGTAALLSAHVQAGDRVALWLPNSFAWLACFFALNELGAVSVPVNTRLTGAELGVILRDAGARILVTTTAYRGRHYEAEAIDTLAREPQAPMIVTASDVDAPADWRRRAGPGPSSSANAAIADDLLCIQYTSGTTATPKGVLLTNYSYLRTAVHVARCQRLTPSTSFISAGPFFHCSGSMHAITACMVAGCTLTSMSIWNPEEFLELVESFQCDTAHMIYFRDVLALASPTARQRLRSLRVAHDLGTRDFLLRVHDELGIEGISNIYGMTETSGQFTMWFPDDPLEKRVSGNGRPQPGNSVRIVDPASGEPMPPGEQGEIQMAGLTLSTGYFNRPDADAAAFTSDGWLRSGDLGRMSEEGELVYLARMKDIIRVGGENFAPAEVEQAIRDLCGVQQVCVLGVPDARLDEVPAAIVEAGGDVEWPQVLQDLRARLAGFKIPREVYVAEQLPITSTNRVQREVLKHSIARGALTRVV